MSRFNKEKLYISYYNQETTVDTFRNRLFLDGEFYKDFTKLGINTMEDALSHTITQIR